MAPSVHHFDSAGRLRMSFGQRGQGPGELGVAYDILAPTHQDPVVRVWDPLPRTVVGFSTDGTLHGISGRIARSPLRVPEVAERMSFGRMIPFARWGGGYLLQDIPPRGVRGPEGTSSVAAAHLLVLDSAGATTDTLVDFSTFTGPTRPSEAVLELAPIPLWTTCADGTAIVVDPYGKRILRYSPSGAAPRADTLPVDGVPITDADITRWIRHAATLEKLSNGATLTEAQINEAVKGFLSSRRGEISAHSPPAVRAACDDTGDLWLQRFDISDDPRGLGRDWVVVADGRIVRQYRFPIRFQPIAFRRGLAFGIQTDSLDVERVATVLISR
jgi:hypothetical protein